MKTLLFIGHSYHQKTKSADFVLSMLKGKYKVTLLYVDPYKETINDCLMKIKESCFDYIVCWQMMPSIKKMRKFINYKKCVFFPMFDGIPSLDNSLWHEYESVKIVCFCKELYHNLKSRRFDCEYIQFFPKPLHFEQWGNIKSLFFWQRISAINLKMVNSLFSTDTLEHVHLHKSLDPNHTYIDYKILQTLSVSTWFDKKEDMFKEIQKHALYMAPRLKEGIGMSFLDAMSMGRCVIAPNIPTMNEYIKDGVTGFLYDFNKPRQLCLTDILRIQNNTYEYIQNGYKKWEKNKYKILKWVEEDVKHCQIKKIKQRNRYYLFGFIPFFEQEVC